MPRFLPIYFVLLCLPFAVLRAQDVVVVDTGDTLHGRIEKVQNGRLFLRTSYAGVIQIDWTKIVEIESNARFRLEAVTGRQYEGEELRRSGEQVALHEEDVARLFRSPTVAEILRYENENPPGFWDQLDGSIGIGYSFTRGNVEQTQSSLSAQGSYRQPKYVLKSDLNSIFSRQDDARANSRHALNGRYDRFLSERAFAFGVTGFERNDRQNLDLRSRFGGGFGWKVARTSGTEFDLLGGVTLTNEQFRAAEGELLPGENSGEGVLGFELQARVFRGIRYTTRLTAHPNLVQTGRYRIEYDSSLRIPLIAGFTWNLSLFDRFDSQPPREGVLRNDYGMVSQFGFQF